MSKEAAIADAINALSRERNDLTRDIKQRQERVDAINHQLEALAGACTAQTETGPADAA